MLSTKLRLHWLFIVILLAGCDNGVQQKVAPVSLPDVDSVSTDSEGVNSKDITDEEAEAFAADWIDALKKGDVAKAGKLVDWRAIFLRAYDSFSISAKMKKEMLKGSMRSVPNMINNLATGVGGESDYRFVRINRRGGHAHILLRVTDPAAGFNYHQFRLRRRKTDDGIQADQYFIAATGEEMSDTLRNVLAPGIASMSLGGRLSGAQDTAMADLKKQKQLKDAMMEGDLEKVRRLYNRLPKHLQKTKLAMLMRIQATPAEDEAAYKTAIDDFLEVFPSDTAAAMISLDAAILNDDIELLEKSHRSLQKWCGGDPYLDLMVGSNMAQLGELEKAKALIEPVDIDSIGLADAHDYRLSYAMELDDHAETLKHLRALRDQYGYEFQDLRNAEGFEAFTKSAEFETWQSEN